MGRFKNPRVIFVTFVFALVGVFGPMQPVSAQTGEDELPDLELEGGRTKIAHVVRFYYLLPVMATVKQAGAGDPKLMALLSRLNLTVSNKVTFYPSAWAEPGPGGSVPVSVDAAYAWTKKELFWLAALQVLGHQTSSPTIQSAFAQYRALCRESRQLQLPAPWVSLGTISESRHFGDINKALPGLSQMEREAIDGESRRIGRQFMAYVLLHEIAHHYLEHITKKKTTEDAQGLELDADEWALRRAASMGYSLADVSAMFRLEAMAEAERLAAGYPVPVTHPRWSTRADRVESLLPQISVSHPDVIRLSGVRPFETHEGMRYEEVTIEFPRDPVTAGTMMSELFIDDSGEALNGVVNHRKSATYLWFRERLSDGPRYVIRIDNALSHEPRAEWQSIGLGQSAPTNISMFSLHSDYAFDGATMLVGRRSLHSAKRRVTEALRQAGAAPHLQADALKAYFAMQHELEIAVIAWVMGDADVSDFDTQWDQVIRARWNRLREILGGALFDRFKKAYFALNVDEYSR